MFPILGKRAAAAPGEIRRFVYPPASICDRIDMNPKCIFSLSARYHGSKSFRKIRQPRTGGALGRLLGIPSRLILSTTTACRTWRCCLCRGGECATFPISDFRSNERRLAVDSINAHSVAKGRTDFLLSVRTTCPSASSGHSKVTPFFYAPCLACPFNGRRTWYMPPTETRSMSPSDARIPLPGRTTSSTFDFKLSIRRHIDARLIKIRGLGPARNLRSVSKLRFSRALWPLS